MNISTDPNKSEFYRPVGSLSSVINKVLGIVRLLIGLFTLSDEDRLEAGIYVGDKGRGGG